MSISTDDESQAVRSSDLVKSAWILLETSVKHYKMGLNILDGSNLPAAQLAPAKNETLVAIAYSAMFMASLAPRFFLPPRREKLCWFQQKFAAFGPPVKSGCHPLMRVQKLSIWQINVPIRGEQMRQVSAR
ncbi:hypothetical protein AYX14_02123 [Cryptococcus neoformans]|nr:hypothetical protein AYX15_01725 [Cryptococcus neoformans var. grubii]OWZ72392.1 hypothetical protein AYX14_02123 [Cryptococcus neoformans var. grubii]